MIPLPSRAKTTAIMAFLYVLLLVSSNTHAQGIPLQALFMELDGASR